jgi:putative ABC transport system substrate-binding protein
MTARLDVLATRRAFVGGVLAFFAASPSEAQQSGKVHRIGYISTGAPSSPLVEAFRQGMRDLGYIEGRNLVVDFRLTAGRTEQLKTMAEELVQRKVEVIVTTGIAAIRAAMEATQTIPIVVIGSSDWVAAGLVSSMARPGGNLTGLSAVAQELNVKRLELLKEVLPGLSRIAVLWDPAGGAAVLHLKALEAPARSVGGHHEARKFEPAGRAP